MIAELLVASLVRAIAVIAMVSLVVGALLAGSITHLAHSSTEDTAPPAPATQLIIEQCDMPPLGAAQHLGARSK